MEQNNNKKINNNSNNSRKMSRNEKIDLYKKEKSFIKLNHNNYSKYIIVFKKH